MSAQVIPLGNPLIVTMGMGQLNNNQPALVQMGAIEYFKVVITAIRDALGDGAKDYLLDDVDFYKIKILLTEINNHPLTNPLYGKISKLIVDKRVRLGAELLSVNTVKSDPLRIVITGAKVLRETNE